MGIGDEVMAAAEAERLRSEAGRRVRIVDELGNSRWHPLWAMNPAIVSPFERGVLTSVTLRNHKGHRPYVLEHHKDRFVFNPTFRAQRAHIYLTQAEREFGDLFADRIVIEPHVPAGKPNKQWGEPNWLKLVELLSDRGLRLIQLGPAGMKAIEGVKHVETGDIRKAAAVLAYARAAVLPEGGLHHIAAAVGLPAVVLFGGFISPTTTGYDLHTNIFTGTTACGQRSLCDHCRKAMDRITPHRVELDLMQLLASTERNRHEVRW